MRKVFVYENNGNCPVEEFFKSANTKIQNKFKYQLDYVKNEKNPLIEPTVKHFSAKKYSQLYQMRMKKGTTLVRVVFYKQYNEIILLYAFYKRDNKDTEKALKISLKILEPLLKNDKSIVCREVV